DGRVYLHNATRNDMMSWDPVALTLGIHLKNTVTETELKENGYRDVHSFGPWLIHEGKLNTESGLRSSPFKLYTQNPRAGIGMVEPGHLVVIVVDGRQDDRSVGLNLLEFAQLFQNENCVEAYNLDGGVSASMVFMGEQLNMHLNVVNKSKQRNLPDGLMWGYTEQCPTLSDPIYNDGIRRGDDANLTLRGE
ncbi:MAG: phosphodiester glycosidase family protein, partial [Clostridia bacterium]|nr:phosphodiester glycosidase family protein [Clostridia bacterium]